jgi:hypothetical protein
MEPGRRLPVGAEGMRPFYTPRKDYAAVQPDGNGIGCAIGSSNCDLSRKNCGQVSCSVAWGYQTQFSLQFKFTGSRANADGFGTNCVVVI